MNSSPPVDCNSQEGDSAVSREPHLLPSSDLPDTRTEPRTRVTVGVAPLRVFDPPFIQKVYSTKEEWLAAAMEGMKRMNSDEEFRKEIERFIS